VHVFPFYLFIYNNKKKRSLQECVRDGDKGIVENHCVLLHFYNGNENLYSWVIKFSQENFET
jgi:hypothetical protein